jgi:hypothetical protein
MHAQTNQDTDHTIGVEPVSPQVRVWLADHPLTGRRAGRYAIVRRREGQIAQVFAASGGTDDLARLTARAAELAAAHSANVAAPIVDAPNTPASDPTDDQRRANLVAAIRQVADFIATSDVPLPKYGLAFSTALGSLEDVHAAAEAMGVSVSKPSDHGDGRLGYRAQRRFTVPGAEDPYVELGFSIIVDPEPAEAEAAEVEQDATLIVGNVLAEPLAQDECPDCEGRGVNCLAHAAEAAAAELQDGAR